MLKQTIAVLKRLSRVVTTGLTRRTICVRFVLQLLQSKQNDFTEIKVVVQILFRLFIMVNNFSLFRFFNNQRTIGKAALKFAIVVYYERLTYPRFSDTLSIPLLNTAVNAVILSANS